MSFADAALLLVFATILSAGIFSLVFIGLGGEESVAGILSNMPGGATGALAFCMFFIFFLGFFLDFVEISVIVLPLGTPTLILLGHDQIWLDVLVAINLQTSFLTPPFGFSLFYLRVAAPKEVTTGHICICYLFHRDTGYWHASDLVAAVAVDMAACCVVLSFAQRVALPSRPAAR